MKRSCGYAGSQWRCARTSRRRGGRR
jgi:hypothetical protein